MNISVNHLDANGRMAQVTHSVSRAAFAKHMAFAGLGIQNAPFRYFRFLAYYFELYQFWAANPTHFSLPSPFDNDPTEKNILSNKIGRTLADFLAKRLYNARYTHCYEDAMVRFGFPITGSRPNFYCDTLAEQFAIEAKGFSRSSVSEEEMRGHKTQSQQGPIPVNFTLASVSYALYTSPKVKFYDPKNDDVECHKTENLQLRNIYYNAVLEMLDFFGLRDSPSEVPGYVSYRVYPSMPIFNVLVHKAIVSREWQYEEWLPDIQKLSSDDDAYYIDADGIGVSLEF